MTPTTAGAPWSLATVDQEIENKIEDRVLGKDLGPLPDFIPNR
jgi:hypothetical protein